MAELDQQAREVRMAVPKPDPLTLARNDLGQFGFRFADRGQNADLSRLEAFIREVVRDEMRRAKGAK